MYRISCILFAIICFGIGNAVAQPDTAWTSRVNVGNSADLYGAAEHENGDFFICGEVILSGSNPDGLLIRMNGLGDTVWTRQFGEANSVQRYNAVAILENGNIVAGGYTINHFGLMLVCYTPDGSMVWSEIMNFSGLCEATDIVALPDGGFAVAAFRPMVGNSNLNLWLLRYNSEGDTLWTQTYGGEYLEKSAGLVLLPDGGFALSGSTYFTGANCNYDFALVKTDSEGNQISFSHFGETSGEQLFCFSRDDNGDFLFGGISRETCQSQSRACVAKTNDVASPFWQDTYLINGGQSQVMGIAPLLDGAVICAGWSGSTYTSSLWIASFGSGGNLIDSWMWGPEGSAFRNIKQLSDGGYICIGRWDGDSTNDAFVLRIVPPSGIAGVVTDVQGGAPIVGAQVSAIGILQYAITDSIGRYALSLGPGTYDVIAYGPCFDRDTIFNVLVEELQTASADLVVGVPHLVQNQTSINIIAHNEEVSTGIMILENTGAGRLRFEINPQSLEPEGDWLSVDLEEGWVEPFQTQEIVVAISADTSNDASYEFYGSLHVRTNSCPDSILLMPVVAIVLDAPQQPSVIESFALHPAYPNPFNAETRIAFDLLTESDVHMRLYNLEGRIAADLLSARLSGGRHELHLNSNNLSTGIYFLRMTAGTFTASQKLILLK